MNPADTFQALTELARLARGLPAECVITSASVSLSGTAIHATHDDPVGVHRLMGATEAHGLPGGCFSANYAGMYLFVTPPRVDSSCVVKL